MAGLFEEKFFKNVKKCWPRDEPPAILEIRDQGKTHACYAFPIVNSIHANMHMHKQSPLLEGSEQELLDCLHLTYPTKSIRDQKISDIKMPEEGYKNTYSNAFKYVREKGLVIENEYPWVGKLNVCRRRTRHWDHIIHIKGYQKIKDQKLVVEELNTVPAVAGTVVLTETLAKWKNDDCKKAEIYAHSDADKEKIKRTYELKEPRRAHAITLVGYGKQGIKYFLIVRLRKFN